MQLLALRRMRRREVAASSSSWSQKAGRPPTPTMSELRAIGTVTGRRPLAFQVTEVFSAVAGANLPRLLPGIVATRLRRRSQGVARPLSW